MMNTDINECVKTDFLTKLSSRSYGLETMEGYVKDKREFSVFYIDLNKFKVVNDLHGHHVGDMVLKEVGRRFKSLEKEGLFFVRFGGDEFIGVYETIDGSKINAIGQDINKVLDEHIIISESEFIISASIGVARYPMDAENVDDLLKLADMAMYKAKKSNSTCNHLISEELNQKLASRRKMEKLLKNIDVENDLFIEYQPIFNVKTGNLTSMEALVRWDHKTEGLIYPNEFISVAEEIDVVKDITKWVFIHSLKQIKIWNEKYGTNFRVSLNAADACIHNKIFFDNVKYMLETFEVKAEWMAIELTECSISVSPEYMKPLLCSIDATGIEIHLDKFGTYPMLISDLKEFKIKGMKIDKSFIDRLDNEEGISIVKGMIMLAKGLEIKTIAMGVETKEQFDILRELDCDEIQGFYLGKPKGKEDFEKDYLANTIHNKLEVEWV